VFALAYDQVNQVTGECLMGRNVVSGVVRCPSEKGVRGMQLSDLTGEELAGVCFVRDYVELHFDGPILRALAPPIVSVGLATASFPEAGSRDLLCSLIGAVVAVAEESASSIRLEFHPGQGEVEIPLSTGGRQPEAAHLVPVRNGRLDPAAMAIWESLG
jgi:hypothetical protein